MGSKFWQGKHGGVTDDSLFWRGRSGARDLAVPVRRVRNDP